MIKAEKHTGYESSLKTNENEISENRQVLESKYPKKLSE